MYAEANFELFLNAHPDKFRATDRQRIMERVQRAAGGCRVVGDLIPFEVFDSEMAEKFVDEATSDPEHHRLAIEVLIPRWPD